MSELWEWIVILGVPTLAMVGLWVMWRVMDR